MCFRLYSVTTLLAACTLKSGTKSEGHTLFILTESNAHVLWANSVPNYVSIVLILLNACSFCDLVVWEYYWHLSKHVCCWHTEIADNRNKTNTQKAAFTRKCILYLQIKRQHIKYTNGLCTRINKYDICIYIYHLFYLHYNICVLFSYTGALYTRSIVWRGAVHFYIPFYHPVLPTGHGYQLAHRFGLPISGRLV